MDAANFCFSIISEIHVHTFTFLFIYCVSIQWNTPHFIDLSVYLCCQFPQRKWNVWYRPCQTFMYMYVTGQHSTKIFWWSNNYLYILFYIYYIFTLAGEPDLFAKKSWRNIQSQHTRSFWPIAIPPPTNNPK